MLIIALVLALIGLVALVFAVVTSNELVAWVCIGASVLGVVLLIIDALQERQRRDAGGDRRSTRTRPDDGLRPAKRPVDYPEEAPHEAARSRSGRKSRLRGDRRQSAVPARAAATRPPTVASSAGRRGRAVSRTSSSLTW